MISSLPRQQHPPGWISRLFREVDNGTLILFRIVFGFLLFFHSFIFITNGSVNEYFIKPSYIFTFIGFEFLQPLHGNGMYYYFLLLAVLGLMIMAGLFYRLSIIMFCLMWQVVYLMQKTNYNNHYYLMLLLCYIMICVPAHRYFSLDVLRRPAIKKLTCPQWVYFLFIAQVTILYFYSAMNKLNPGWLSGSFYESLYLFKRSFPLLGSLYGYGWYKIFIVWGGLMFDLLVCPLLLWKKTRKISFITACFFHLFNSYVLSIKIFPYLCIGLFIFFLDPVKVSSIFFRKKRNGIIQTEAGEPNRVIWPVVYLLTSYLLIQVVLPLRPLFFPGNTSWTEEGHRMSWRMMLANKRGEIHFVARDSATGKEWKNLEQRLTQRQIGMLAIRPDITRQDTNLCFRMGGFK